MKDLTRSFLLICAISAFAIALVTGGLHNINRSVSPVRKIGIGALLCLSGTCAEWGQNALRGAQLAVEEINGRGGIRGVALELVVEDSREDSPANALSALRSLIARDLHYIIGPSWTPAAQALAPVAVKKPDIIFISPSVGVADFNEAGANLFNLWPHDATATKLLAAHAFSQGFRRGAVASSQQPWENLQGNTFEQEFERLGGRIVEKTEPLPAATDLKPEAARLAQADAEFVFMSNFGQMGLFAKELIKAGFNGTKYAILMDQTRIRDANGALDSTRFALYPEAAKDFRSNFQARFSEPPGNSADTAYDAVHLLANALRNTDPGDAPAVARALASVSGHQGASGEISIDENRAVHRLPVLWQVSGVTYRRLS